MPLVSLTPLLARAEKEKRAVGAFNVSGIEMIYGVMRAAEETGTPVVLQVAEKRLATTPLPVLGKAMIAAAESSELPVAVHLDHGETEDCVRLALDLGFSSVMFDGSLLPTEESIRRTAAMAELAHRCGATCEGEIGALGRSESGEERRASYTDPEEALIFARETGVDALAVAIGNAHGLYTGTPVFHFEVLDAIRAGSDIPLVLHGGTGSCEENFRRCIASGVRKINIATALFRAAARAAREAEEEYFAMSRAVADAVYRTAEEHILLFNGGAAPRTKEAAG